MLLKNHLEPFRELLKVPQNENYVVQELTVCFG